MKQKLLNNFKLRATLLVAMLCAAFTGAWAEEAVYTFNTDAGLTALEITKPAAGAGTDLGTSAYVVDGVSMSATNGGTATRVWNSNGTTDLRIYKNGGTLTFSAATNITSIVLAGATVNVFNANVGTFSSGTWTGSATSVTLSATGTGKINTITVTYEAGGSTPTCAAPTFSPAAGTYTSAQNVEISCATDGATIYYTTDGNDPTTSSSTYSSAITVDETTTIKAIAVADNYNNSSVATATYTITAPSTIAAVRAQGTGSVFTQGLVTSCSGTTAYIQDATAAICVYGTSLTVGDIVNVSGTLTTYNGLLEITSPKVTVVSSDNTVTPTVKTIAEINSDYAASNEQQGYLIKIENATVTGISSKNVTIAQDENTIVVRFNNTSDIDFAVNDVITLTGNIGCFNAAQIANPTDITKVELEPNTITVKQRYYYNQEYHYYEIPTNPQHQIGIVNYEHITFVVEANGATATAVSSDNSILEINALEEANTFEAIGTGGSWEGQVVTVTFTTTSTSTYEAAERTITFLVKRPAAPTFSVEPGTYGETQYVELSTVTGSSNYGMEPEYEPEIWYVTTDDDYDFENNDEPDQIVGHQYDGTPIEVSKTTTIKAWTYRYDLNWSEASTATYIIDSTPSVTLPQYEFGVNADGGDAEIPVTCTHLADEPQLVVVFFEADGTTPAQYDWISASINNNGNIAGHMEPNTGDARTAYFKVAGLDANQNWVYSDLVTINQDAYTGPSITMSESSIDFEIGGGSKTLSIESVSLGSNPSFDVQFFESDGETTTECGWIYYQFDSNDNKVTITGIANDEGVARTAYFKVYTEVNKTLIYSDLVTVNQAGPDYTVLPFYWEGGASADFLALNGVTAKGLGADYAAANAPYLIKLDGTGDYIQIKTDSQPGVMSVDVKMIGGAVTSTITVQESADGEEFSNVETLTISGKQAETLTLTTTNTFADNSRFVRLLFTKGSNVGVGSISIAAYEAPSTDPSITVSTSYIEATDAEADGTITVTYNNFTPVAADIVFYLYDGESPAEYDWIDAEINGDGNIEYVISANTGDSRTACMKVYALDSEANEVYSDLIWIEQAAYVAPAETVTYTLATTLSPGKTYVIASGTAGDVKVMGGQNTNNRGAVDGTIEGTTLSVMSDAGACEVVVYGPDAAGNYTFYTGVAGYLYAASSSSNYLKSQETNNAEGKWSVNIDGNTKDATVVAQGNNSRRYMRFNSTLFSCYGESSSVKDLVYFFEKDGDPVATTASVTLNSYGYATFATTAALDFLDSNDADFSAWQITKVEGSTITFDQLTGHVAAGVGVLLKGTADATINLNILPDGGSTTDGTNKLVGITEETPVEADQYYGLKGDQFQKVNAGTIPAGKALLPASSLTAGVKAFTFIFNDADGIQTVQTVSAEAAQAIYNLAGQRLPKAQKGINIINGKKVLVK